MDAVQHTTTLHTYRKTFITSESSEKLKLALKKNIRNHQTFYNLGDKVFYKQDNLPQWKGLAKILGKNRPVLTLRHGAGYVKAHICRVQLTNHKKLKILQEKSNETTEEPNNVNNNKKTKETESSGDENNDDDNDNTTLDNSSGRTTNGIKLSSPP